MKSIEILCLLFVLLFSAQGMKIRSQLEATSQMQATTGAQLETKDRKGCIILCSIKHFLDLNAASKCARNC